MTLNRENEKKKDTGEKKKSTTPKIKRMGGCGRISWLKGTSDREMIREEKNTKSGENGREKQEETWRRVEDILATLAHTQLSTGKRMNSQKGEWFRADDEQPITLF